MDGVLANGTLTATLAVGTLVAIVALYFAIRGIVRSRRMKYWGPMLITIEDPQGRKYSLQAADLRYDDLVKLLAVLNANAARRRPHSAEAGAVSLEALLMTVPAIIALLFVVTILFMAVRNNSIPDPLVNWLTVIIGYYFGVGAKSVSSTGQKVTPQQAEELLSQDKDLPVVVRPAVASPLQPGQTS
jgi:hypothetical protein